MTSMVAKMVSKRLLKEGAKNNFGMEDPYFETVPATRLDGKPSSSGKMKKRRKALPVGISEHDGKILTKVKRRAYRMDMGLFNCCGLKFGWGSVIGIVPGFGDVADAFMAMMVFRTCQQIEGGLPTDVRAMMLFNIIIDFAIGLVPFLGDIADALFRANTRNAVLLENHLRKKGAAALKAQGQSTPALDPSDPAEFDRQLNAELGPPPGYTEGSSRPATGNGAAAGSGHPQTYGTTSNANSNAAGRSGGGGGFFSKKTKPTDLEQGGGSQPGRNKSALQKDRR